MNERLQGPDRSSGYGGPMIRRVSLLVLIGVVMGGCTMSPGGTVKVDGDKYAAAEKKAESLFSDATDLIRETSGGTDGDISGVQSQPCGEAYADNLRKIEMGSSFQLAEAASEDEIIDSVEDGLVSRGWKKKKGQDGTFRFDQGIPGGATLKLYVTVSGNLDEDGQTPVRLSVESTCMDIPKGLAEKI